MKRWGLLWLIGGLVLDASIATAQGRSFQVRGEGFITCAEWSEHRRASVDDRTLWPRLVQESWVLGYVTSYGEHGPIAIADMDNGAMLAWVDKYCQSHPQERVHDAANGLISELRIQASAPKR